MSSEGGEYIHGSEPNEQQRLSLLNDLLNDLSLETLDLRVGERALDVGSGLGQFTRRMAAAVTDRGHVLGVERDEGQLQEARRQAHAAGEEDRVEFRCGEATALPLEDNEWGSFDVVHARFLLEHVPDPQAVVDAMLHACRPGGRIILEDDDHDVLRLWPEPEGVYDVWRAYIETYWQLGNDPFIGRRLVELIEKGGALPERNGWHFFGSCAGHKAFGDFVENFAGVIDGARETVVSMTSTTAGDIDAALAAFGEWGKLPNAALWYCTFWAEGRKPQSS